MSDTLNVTDDQWFAALMGQAPDNPNGCSVVDALIGLGIYQEGEAAMARLLESGRIKQVSPGNYLPIAP